MIARVILDLNQVRWGESIKEREKVSTGIPQLDYILDGGWIKGKISVLKADSSISSGKTSIATFTVAHITRKGLLASWIDINGEINPSSLAQAGAILSRILWVRGPMDVIQALCSAEEVILSGLFEVIVIDLGIIETKCSLHQPTTQLIRLSRNVEKTMSVVLFLGGKGWFIPGAINLFFKPIQWVWDKHFFDRGEIEVKIRDNYTKVTISSWEEMI